MLMLIRKIFLTPPPSRKCWSNYDDTPQCWQLRDVPAWGQLLLFKAGFGTNPGLRFKLAAVLIWFQNFRKWKFYWSRQYFQKNISRLLWTVWTLCFPRIKLITGFRTTSPWCLLMYWVNHTKGKGYCTMQLPNKEPSLKMLKFCLYISLTQVVV
jgi:hypothetical protein